MDLNTLGDFMAGVFAPHAFLWLVLGYRQQGIELRQNSEALHKQAEELKNSGEQQRQLVVTAAAASLNLERDRIARAEVAQRTANRPNFDLTASMKVTSERKNVYRLDLENVGMDVTRVTLDSEGQG